MKTILINPAGSVKEECCSGKVLYKTLPSQIFLAARYLMDNKKDIDVVDAQTQEIPKLDKYDIVVVWVCVFDTFYSDIALLKRAKKQGKTTIMVLNDPMGVELDIMKDFAFIDICIRLYEREIVLNKVIEYLQQKKEFDFKGIIYRKNGKIVDKGEMPFGTNVDYLKSHKDIIKKLPLRDYQLAHITPGRGCPMACTFCQYRKSGSRQRKIREVMEEFDLISKNIPEIYFNDPNMISNLKWFNEFLDELIRRKNKKEWKADLRIDLCSEKILRKLKKAGCKSILFGIESLDQRIVEKIQKNIPIKEGTEAVKKCEKVGLVPDVTFMIGFPWDDDESIKKIYEFIKKSNVINFGITFVMPIKGTPLYEDYKELGLIKKDLSYQDYINARFDIPVSNTLHLSKKELARWFKKIQRLRFRSMYILKYIRFFGLRLKLIKTFLILFRRYFSGHT